MLGRFAGERLLYRLSVSEHAEHFVLKGTLLFLLWTGHLYHPTRRGLDGIWRQFNHAIGRHRAGSLEKYLIRHNRGPKPFIWTAKANDILAKVARARKKLPRKGKLR